MVAFCKGYQKAVNLHWYKLHERYFRNKAQLKAGMVAFCTGYSEAVNLHYEKLTDHD